MKAQENETNGWVSAPPTSDMGSFDDKVQIKNNNKEN